MATDIKLVASNESCEVTKWAPILIHDTSVETRTAKLRLFVTEVTGEQKNFIIDYSAPVLLEVVTDAKQQPYADTLDKLYSEIWKSFALQYSLTSRGVATLYELNYVDNHRGKAVVAAPSMLAAAPNNAKNHYKINGWEILDNSRGGFPNQMAVQVMLENIADSRDTVAESIPAPELANMLYLEVPTEAAERKKWGATWVKYLEELHKQVYAKLISKYFVTYQSLTALLWMRNIQIIYQKSRALFLYKGHYEEQLKKEKEKKIELKVQSEAENLQAQLEAAYKGCYSRAAYFHIDGALVENSRSMNEYLQTVQIFKNILAIVEKRLAQINNAKTEANIEEYKVNRIVPAIQPYLEMKLFILLHMAELDNFLGKYETADEYFQCAKKFIKANEAALDAGIVDLEEKVTSVHTIPDGKGKKEKKSSCVIRVRQLKEFGAEFDRTGRRVIFQGETGFCKIDCKRTLQYIVLVREQLKEKIVALKKKEENDNKKSCCCIQ